MAKLVNYNGFVAPFDPEMEYYNEEEYSNEIIKPGLREFSLFMRSFSKTSFREQLALFLMEDGELQPLSTLLKIQTDENEDENPDSPDTPDPNPPSNPDVPDVPDVPDEPSVDDQIVDNNWPIEWTQRGVANNKVYGSVMMRLQRISDLIGYDYANIKCAVSILPDSGGEAVLTTRTLSVIKEFELGKEILVEGYYDNVRYWIGLIVIEKTGTYGDTEFDKTGTYFDFLDDGMTHLQFSNADVKFTLTQG